MKSPSPQPLVRYLSTFVLGAGVSALVCWKLGGFTADSIGLRGGKSGEVQPASVVDGTGQRKSGPAGSGEESLANIGSTWAATDHAKALAWAQTLGGRPLSSHGSGFGGIRNLPAPREGGDTCRCPLRQDMMDRLRSKIHVREATADALGPARWLTVSIHAPVREATFQVPGTAHRNVCFNPRPP